MCFRVRVILPLVWSVNTDSGGCVSWVSVITVLHSEAMLQCELWHNEKE